MDHRGVEGSGFESGILRDYRKNNLCSSPTSPQTKNGERGTGAGD